jgi:hypothetical protein
MSVEHSQFEFRVRTPMELAGAEEAAGELERAVGKARALGRNSLRLERQLDRVRQGMRHFRLAHPGIGRRRGEGEDEREEETEAGKRGFRRRSAMPGLGAAREDAEGELSPGSISPGDEAMAEAGPAAEEEPATAVWNARAQRAVEEMVRQAMAKREAAPPRREASEEGRIEAVERRLQLLEQRARMNRDGG